MGGLLQQFGGRGGDFQELGNRPLVGLLTVPWNCGGASSSWAPFVAQLVKNPPAVRETWVQALGWEDPLEKGKAAHPSILAGEFHGLSSPWGHRGSLSVVVMLVV